MYARLAAYRPRRTRPCSRSEVSRSGGVVRSPSRKKRMPRATRREHERTWRNESGTKRDACGAKSVAATDTASMIVAVGTRERVGGEHRLQSQENVDRARLRPASRGEFSGRGTSASASARTRLFHLACIGYCYSRSRGKREREREGERKSRRTDLHMQRLQPIAGLPALPCGDDDD